MLSPLSGERRPSRAGVLYLDRMSMMDAGTGRVIEALIELIEEWYRVAYPPGEPRDVPALNGLWHILARALCRSDVARLSPFMDELSALRRTPRAGAPPVRALERRLSELVECGLDELFIVLAVRHALDRLIEVHAPGGLQAWQQMAEAALPLRLQFARRPDEL